MKNKVKIKNLIIDVDGVMTDGGFYYTVEGKVMKKFGPDDVDALTLIEDKLNVHFISGDKRGLPITKKRIADDMGFKLDLVSTFERLGWIKEHFDPKETIYIADGIFDGIVFKKVAYSIAPSNAFEGTKRLANFVTKNKGGQGALAEAIIHILKIFFHQNFNVDKLDLKKGSGAWKKR